MGEMYVKEEDADAADASFEDAYDRWRDDCAAELCADIEKVVRAAVGTRNGYFHNQPAEAFRCVEVFARVAQEKME
jgi:hypothetical protein